MALRSARMAGRQRILKGQLQTLSISIHATGGAGQQPSAATFSLIRPAGTSVIAAGATTYAAGLIQYALAAASTTGETVGPDWLIEWLLTMGDGEVLIVRRSAALVLRSIYPSIADADLSAYYPELAKLIPYGQNGTWEPQITEGWNIVNSRLFEARIEENLILSSEQLRSVHLAETMAIIADMLDGGDGRSKWEGRRARWEARAIVAWSRLTVDLDTNEDGIPQGSEDGIARFDPSGSPVDGPAGGARDF
mgnify:CR=1 FL=1